MVDPDDVVLAWIQERITCNIPDKKTDPELYVTKYQMHQCNDYCSRLTLKDVDSTFPERQRPQPLYTL